MGLRHCRVLGGRLRRYFPHATSGRFCRKRASPDPRVVCWEGPEAKKSRISISSALGRSEIRPFHPATSGAWAILKSRRSSHRERPRQNCFFRLLSIREARAAPCQTGRHGRGLPARRPMHSSTSKKKRAGRFREPRHLHSYSCTSMRGFSGKKEKNLFVGGCQDLPRRLPVMF